MKQDNQIALARTISNCNPSRESYRPEWGDGRKGAQDHEAVPSRRGDTLYYRDGEQEKVE